jgi:hypothetical protein
MDEQFNYLLWLCKRLVYKYNEDPQIIKTVEEILQKCQSEISFYRQTHQCINQKLDEAIGSLNQIKTSYAQSISNANKDYSENKIKESSTFFEQLDIEGFFLK